MKNLPEEDQRDFLINEIRRFTLGKFFQQNKFLATPGQIRLAALDLRVEI